ncbi:hypothetical protein ABZN20_02195 [Methylococcus sp. ANG]|uniref:hypothetical protein n=1 Tax=Methylococcus sp. ANG TaxID=3231903 RepID=UPI0034581E4F
MTTQSDYIGLPLRAQETVSDAAPRVVDLSRQLPPIKVAIAHGAGNVERVETLEAGEWIPWALGDITAASALDVLLRRVAAIRFTRVSGSSPFSYEVMV